MYKLPPVQTPAPSAALPLGTQNLTATGDGVRPPAGLGEPPIWGRPRKAHLLCAAVIFCAVTSFFLSPQHRPGGGCDGSSLANQAAHAVGLVPCSHCAQDAAAQHGQAHGPAHTVLSGVAHSWTRTSPAVFLTCTKQHCCLHDFAGGRCVRLYQQQLGNSALLQESSGV